MKRRISFVNIRALPDEKERSKVKSPFVAYLKQNGINGESPMNMMALGGEIFAVMEGGRSAGGVWVRRWPAAPSIGDIHVALSKFRFKDYESLIAFDVFLMERARVMAFNRWRVIVKEDDDHVIKALTFVRFKEVSRQSFPGVGKAVILEREVI